MERDHSIRHLRRANYPIQTKSRVVNDFDDAQCWNAQIHPKQTTAKCKKIGESVKLNSFDNFYLRICESDWDMHLSTPKFKYHGSFVYCLHKTMIKVVLQNACNTAKDINLLIQFQIRFIWKNCLLTFLYIDSCPIDRCFILNGCASRQTIAFVAKWFSAAVITW